jgi:hypothetical protein
MLCSRKARLREFAAKGRVREDVLVARAYDRIAHHHCGTSNTTIVVDALRGNVTDKISKPTLCKIFSVPAATGLARP